MYMGQVSQRFSGWRSAVHAWITNQRSRRDTTLGFSYGSLRGQSVLVQQPYLVPYRVDLFRQLVSQYGLTLGVFCERLSGDQDFDQAHDDLLYHVSAPLQLVLGPYKMFWHRGQLRAALAGDTQILVLSWDIRYLSLFPAIVLARLSGKRVLLWGHGYSKSGARASERARLTIAHTANAVVAYGYESAQWIEEHSGALRVFVVPNTINEVPIELVREAWLREGRATAAQSLDVVGTRALPARLLFVSRMRHDKGIGSVLSAVQALRARGLAVHADLVGDGPALPALQREAERLAIQEHVVFHGALYDQAQLSRLFMLAHVFVHPRNIGLSAIHALAYGLPVVTSNDLRRHGPEAEAVIHGYNGLLYLDGSDVSMVDMLQRLINDSFLRAQLSRNALEWVSANRRMDQMVSGFANAFLGVLQPTRTR